MNVLFIDNFDSFGFNLVDEFKRRDCHVEVWRNTLAVDKAIHMLEQMVGPKLLVISPGPGHPQQAGCCIELIKQCPAGIPILGVCLGHQAIVEAFGGRVGSAGTVIHGKASRVNHQEDGIFEGLPNPLLVGRYHSLAAQTVPDVLNVTARFDDIVMAVSHHERPIVGLQFHPESILTPRGGILIDHMLDLTAHNAKEPERI